MRTDSPRPPLHRSRADRMICGVCGGLADYFDLDSTIVRIGFVVAALIPPFAAVSLIGYPVLCLLLPVEGNEQLQGRERLRTNLSGLGADLRDVSAEVRASVASFGKGRQPASPSTVATPAGEPAATETNGTAAPAAPDAPSGSSARAA